jgi:carboxymethylenebutenolidase
VKERFAEIPTADGRMETFVTHPEQDGPFPPVVLYMDVWGVREELYDLARRIATVGYYVTVPDFYYRQGKFRSTFINDKGEHISLAKLSEEDQAKVLEPAGKLADSMVVADTGAILKFFRDSGDPVRPGGVGSIGYCMGGRHVMQVAVAYPEAFKASASLHGTTLISDRPDSPHLGVARLRGELYCGFAEFDHYAPLPMVEKLGALLKPCQVRYTHAIHKGAEHGYALPDRDIYDKKAAERDWELIFAMFHRQIPAYAR